MRIIQNHVNIRNSRPLINFAIEIFLRPMNRVTPYGNAKILHFLHQRFNQINFLLVFHCQKYLYYIIIIFNDIYRYTYKY